MMSKRYSFLRNYKNSEIETVIDEWIHSDIHRHILKSKMIDDKTFENLAAEFYTSVTSVKNAVYRYEDVIKNGLEKMEKGKVIHNRIHT